MSKYTYKEIKQIIGCTPKEYAGKEIRDVNQSKTGAIYQGYFKKTSANWCYQVNTILDKDGYLVNVVSVFGHIVAE